jgi:PAS domain S-box-containing protein
MNGNTLPRRHGLLSPSGAALQGFGFPALAAAVYLAFSAAWITLSDSMGALLFSSPEQLTRFQTWKGVLFIAASALTLFLLLRRAEARRVAAAPAPRVVPAWRLGVMLTALVMATALPMLALIGMNLQREAGRDVRESRRLIVGLTEAAAADAAAWVASQERLAAMLSRRVAVLALHPGQCDTLPAEMQAQRPAIINVMTVGLDGRTVCATSPVESSGVQGWREAFEGGVRSVTSHPLRNARSGRWEIVMAWPLRGTGGSLIGALEIVLDLAALQPARAGSLPQGGVLAILDGDRWYLARSADANVLVGTQAPDSASARTVRTQRIGEITGPGPDGVQRLYAFRPIAGTSWFAMSGVPTDALYAPARHNALLYAAMAAIAIGLAALMVVVIARRIAGPMLALAETARRVGEGQLDERAPESGPLEVAQVATAFNRMLDKLPVVEQELRESLERHRSLVELAPDGILVQDGHTPVYANAGLRRLLGLAEDAPASRLSLIDFTEPSQRARMATRMARLAVDPGSCAVDEFLMLRADGTLIEVEHAASAVRMHDHHIAVQSYLRDVTARNQLRREQEAARETLEARIRERTAELQASNEALASFSRSVAHDLRAPLATANGFATLMERAATGGDCERAANHARRVHKILGSMGSMVDGLLRLARNDGAGLDRSTVEMDALVREVLDEHQAADKARVTLELLPAVRGDRTMLRQVWCNLVSNAIKYASRVEAPHITISAAAGGADSDDGWTFTVADNGAGFDPADAARLFQPFERLPGSQDFEGTGIGLTIARRIVERHAGRIWAEAAPGQGAKFHFWIPG